MSASVVMDAVAGAMLAVPAQGVDPELADRMPGLGAFIVFAILAVALYFLLKNMNARLRRMSYREREREAQEAAAAAQSDVAAHPEPGASKDRLRLDEPELGDRSPEVRRPDGPAAHTDDAHDDGPDQRGAGQRG